MGMQLHLVVWTGRPDIRVLFNFEEIATSRGSDNGVVVITGAISY